MKLALAAFPSAHLEKSIRRLWGLALGLNADKCSLWLPSASDVGNLRVPSGISHIWAGPETASAANCEAGFVANCEAGFATNCGGFAIKCAIWMEHLAKMEGVDIVLAESGAASSESAIRLSYRLGFSAVSGLVDVSLFNGMPCAKMRAASSHLDLFRPIEKNQVLIARPSKIYSGNFDSFAPIRILPMPDVEADFIEERILPRSKASSLEDAQLLLVGGRGIKGPAAFKRLQEIAGKLGGAAGLTRAAAINGWGPMELVVGQSGIAASPKACVVFGASGAAAFMAGVEDSERLIAVNNDPDAPIFSKSDYGIIADAPSAIERLEEILSDADKGCG